MAQPVEFTRQQDYSDFQNFNAEGTELNREFDDLKITLDQIRTNIDILQKDDGQLGNELVGSDQLKDDVLGSLLQSGIDSASASAVSALSLIHI